jgi:D-threo-aldose 1-dehydrogenase
MIEIGNTGVRVTRLGLGGSGIGNLYRATSETEAKEVIDAAMAEGVRYFDTAPMYGRGLSEQRLGNALAGYPRDSFVVSTKVSELIVNGEPDKRMVTFRAVDGRKMVRDWSGAGTVRSIEESLERLGLDHVEIIFIHDTFGDDADKALETTYPVLAEMRDRGEVKAIGVGMNDPDILSRYVRECDLDCLLLWGSYSLLNFRALDELLPLCVENNVDIISGAPYESGILASDLSAGSAKYQYRDAPEEILQKALSIDAVCRRYNVPLKAAALQFVFGHPRVKSVIPGTRSPERLRDNVNMLSFEIPSDLWSELKAEKLIPDTAPVR